MIEIQVNTNELLFIKQSIISRIDYYNNSKINNAIKYVKDLQVILDKIKILETKHKKDIEKNKKIIFPKLMKGIKWKKELIAKDKEIEARI